MARKTEDAARIAISNVLDHFLDADEEEIQEAEALTDQIFSELFEFDNEDEAGEQIREKRLLVGKLVKLLAITAEETYLSQLGQFLVDIYMHFLKLPRYLKVQSERKREMLIDVWEDLYQFYLSRILLIAQMSLNRGSAAQRRAKRETMLQLVSKRSIVPSFLVKAQKKRPTENDQEDEEDED